MKQHDDGAAAVISSSEGLRAVIYLRVSTQQQAVRDGNPEGYSLPTQRAVCHQKAKELGAEIVEEYIDKDTGTSVDKRPSMLRLLERIERLRDIDLVIVFKLDRWARKTREDLVSDFVLEVAGCDLVSCSEQIDRSAAGRLLHSMMASVNEYQSNNQSDDIKRKTLAKVQNGGTHGRAPLGYLNKQDSIDIRYVVVDEERSPLIAGAFEAYATGDWTTRQLVAELNRRGLRTRRGKKSPEGEIQLSGLQHMLTNPYYKGTVVFRGVEYAGKHTPLVTEALWQKVQHILVTKSMGEKQRSHHHYLKSSLWCDHCGSRMIVSHNKNRQGITYRYFVCVGRHQKRTDCQMKAQSIDVVEALVTQLYLQVRLSAKVLIETRASLIDELRRTTELAEEERKRQELRIKQLDGERAALLRAHLADAVPMDLLKREQDRLTRELTSARELLARYELEADRIEATLNRAVELASDCHATYAASVPAGRRLMNQAFFKKLYLSENGIVRWELAEPFNVLLGAETESYLVHVHNKVVAEAEGSTAPKNGNGPYERGRPIQAIFGKQLDVEVKELLVVEAMGLEPTTSCLQSKCSSQLSYAPVTGPTMYRPSGRSFEVAADK